MPRFFGSSRGSFRVLLYLADKHGTSHDSQPLRYHNLKSHMPLTKRIHKHVQTAQLANQVSLHRSGLHHRAVRLKISGGPTPSHIRSRASFHLLFRCHSKRSSRNARTSTVACPRRRIYCFRHPCVNYQSSSLSPSLPSAEGGGGWRSFFCDTTTATVTQPGPVVNFPALSCVVLETQAQPSPWFATHLASLPESTRLTMRGLSGWSKSGPSVLPRLGEVGSPSGSSCGNRKSRLTCGVADVVPSFAKLPRYET